mgnify:CR=1 FL=1
MPKFYSDVDSFKYAWGFKSHCSTWLNKVANYEGFTIHDLNIIITSDDKLLEINKEFLKHNTYTDIVTFDYNVGTTINGELYISIDRITENAQMLEIDSVTELKRVIVHGLLHLMGYNDANASEKRTMKLKEDFYLNWY